MLRILALLFAFPTVLAAGNQWPNSCDPTDLGTCDTLILLYEWGSAPFPNEPTRAQALRDLQTAHFRQQCEATGAEGCLELLSAVLGNGLASEEARKDTIAFVRDRSEAACTAGAILACRTRANVTGSPQVVQAYLQDAEATEEARNATVSQLAEDSRAWSARTATLAEDRLAELQTACADANLPGCIEFHRLARLAKGHTLSGTQQLDDFLPLCIAGSNAACHELSTPLSRLARNADTPDPAYSDAIAALEQACNDGSGTACHTRANRITAPAEADMQRDLYETGCTYDHGPSCEQLGLTRLRAAQFRPDDDTLQALTRACDLGIAVSCHFLEHLTPVLAP